MPKKSRMFHLDQPKPIKRCNPVVGCKHHCYGDGCWAARTARRLSHLERYRDGFDNPKLVETELSKRFGKGAIVFVSSMGDLFGEWVPDEWINEVIHMMERSPDATFFLETKNPDRYREFIYGISSIVILSTTIESNRNYSQSKAPPPFLRYRAMSLLPNHIQKHVSIEPIMDFDMGVLVRWMKNLRPILVSVGYDNYNCHLPEPPLEKTLKLIAHLEKFTKVERKTLREGRKQ